MKRVRNRGVASKTLAAISFLALPGCAFLNRDNTPITNYVEEKLSPESARAQEALVPVLWPVATVTLIADAAVLHPISVVDDAFEDTRDVLWDDFDWDEEYATECFKLPWRAIFTPIVFGFDFLGRSLFDIEPHDRREEARAEATRVTGEVSKLLEEGRIAEAAALLEELSEYAVRVSDDPLKQEYCRLRLRLAFATGDYAWFAKAGWRSRRHLERPEVHGPLLPVLEQMLGDDHSFTRLKAYNFARTWLDDKEREPYLLRQLADPDPVIRFNALSRREWWYPPDDGFTLSPELRAALDRLATTDPDSAVRAQSAEILRLAAKPTPDTKDDRS